MRLWVATVFDDFIPDSATVYTASFHESRLGTVEQLAIQAITENVLGSDVRLYVAVQSTNDGRNWSAVSSVPEINSVTVSTGVTSMVVGATDGSVPPGGLVRLIISLSGTGRSCYLKLSVCGRGSAASYERGSVTSATRRSSLLEAGPAPDESRELDDDIEWMTQGGDDALFDDATKKHMAALEATYGCDDAVVHTVRAELQRQLRLHNETCQDVELSPTSTASGVTGRMYVTRPG